MSLHFFDVGANVGQTFDDYLLKSDYCNGADVWCFEPSPRHLPGLIERVSRADVRDRFKIHVCPFGLRGGNGIETFFQKDDPRGDSFEHYLASDHLTKNIPTGYALHQFACGVRLMILGHTKPGDEIVLKLDCEGSEYNLLNALANQPDALERISRILVEFHFIEPNPDKAMHEINRLHERFHALGRKLERWVY